MTHQTLTEAQKALIRQALSLQADLMLNRKPKSGEKRLQRVLGKLGVVYTWCRGEVRHELDAR